MFMIHVNSILPKGNHPLRNLVLPDKNAITKQNRNKWPDPEHLSNFKFIFCDHFDAKKKKNRGTPKERRKKGFFFYITFAILHFFLHLNA